MFNCSDCSELLAEYHYGDGRIVRVYACYDDARAFDRRSPSFFDCFDGDGSCLNEGDPWYTLPDWQECAGYVTPALTMTLPNEGGNE